ncbi:MAG: deoxynucleoside kinase, partial [Gammaproteobacteria bacterium]
MSESRYIVIEGPIAVGKTSLARRLAASLDSELLLEQAEANPFL